MKRILRKSFKRLKYAACSYILPLMKEGYPKYVTVKQRTLSQHRSRILTIPWRNMRLYTPFKLWYATIVGQLMHTIPRTEVSVTLHTYMPHLISSYSNIWLEFVIHDGRDTQTSSWSRRRNRDSIRRKARPISSVFSSTSLHTWRYRLKVSVSDTTAAWDHFVCGGDP